MSSAAPDIYPASFPIKVMGLASDMLAREVVQIAHRFDPAVDENALELRRSSGGKYLGVTVTVTAHSREQLQDLQRALAAHPPVKVVL